MKDVVLWYLKSAPSVWLGNLQIKLKEDFKNRYYLSFWFKGLQAVELGDPKKKFAHLPVFLCKSGTCSHQARVFWTSNFSGPHFCISFSQKNAQYFYQNSLSRIIYSFRSKEGRSTFKVFWLSTLFLLHSMANSKILFTQ